MMLSEEKYAQMLVEEEKRIVRELKELGATLIILFGSRVRGKADLLADLDMLVVVESHLPFVERAGWFYRRLAPRVAADILFYTPGEWEKVQETPFIKEGIREGRVLYAQKPVG